MDLQGSLVDTKLKIIPSKKLLDFLHTISSDEVPVNIAKLTSKLYKKTIELDTSKVSIKLSKDDIKLLDAITPEQPDNTVINFDETLTENILTKDVKPSKATEDLHKEKTESIKRDSKDFSDILITDEDLAPKEKEPEPSKEAEEPHRDFLETLDIEWLYSYLEKQRNSGKDVPFLNILLDESEIKLPKNQVMKRNPVLEARCVTLRSQQESRDYRKMTKTVDNVRMRYPEDSISYQLKHLNRQLIAIGQFIISIFAGFLFGFRGVEWMVGNLDFGFRLLLGVMCALIIALAEIYFLAKKLNEEYNVPETVQLGGPTKFANEIKNPPKMENTIKAKEHED